MAKASQLNGFYMMQNPTYGHGDSTYKAAGEEAGLRRIVNCFYSLMSTNSDYQTIRSWHPEDIAESEDKLVLFLCGWTGGPRKYTVKYGPINIIQAHRHLRVTDEERDQWLNCMRDALTQLEYPVSFIEYLVVQLAHPAERIRQTCQAHVEE